MNRFSFDFYNRNFALRVGMTAALAAIDKGLLVYLGDDSVLTVVSNDTDAAYLDNIYLLAQPVAIGAVYFVGYPISKELWIKGEYKGKDIGILPGEDVTVHSGYVVPFEDLDNGEVLFEIVSIGGLVDSGIEEDITVVTGGAALTAGNSFTLDGASKTTKTITSAAYVYVAADAYTSGTTVTVKVYKAPCVIKLI